MNAVEFAILRNGEALQGLAAASGLELRRVAELAAEDNLIVAIRLVELRHHRKESMTGRQAQVRARAKRWPT